jgi:hypothetical protein
LYLFVFSLSQRPLGTSLLSTAPESFSFCSVALEGVPVSERVDPAAEDVKAPSIKALY